MERTLAKGKGCVLLGAHLGSFEVLRVLGSLERKLPVNVLLYPDNASNADAVASDLCPELKHRVIPLGRPDTLLRVHECLERGEIVGILGDRTLKSDKTVRCDFLGAPATFPQGPLLLASILKAPVAAVLRPVPRRPALCDPLRAVRRRDQHRPAGSQRAAAALDRALCRAPRALLPPRALQLVQLL